jgi:NAD(P)-dependent dehydrogenase (short-subunit alcohol dehydrogenase family)
VVTGGTLGLGAAVVKTLADAGARVATSARTLPAQPVAGLRTMLFFDLAPAEGLEPWLGAWGLLLAIFFCTFATP